MVTVPLPSRTRPRPGEFSCRLKTSGGSGCASSVSAISSVWRTSPGAKVTNPLTGVKSASDVAVPDDEPIDANTGPSEGRSRATTTRASPSDSETCALPIQNTGAPGAASLSISAISSRSAARSRLTGLVRMTCSVSIGSTRVSSMIGTRTVRTVRPGSNDRLALKMFGVPIGSRSVEPAVRLFTE